MRVVQPLGLYKGLKNMKKMSKNFVNYWKFYCKARQISDIIKKSFPVIGGVWL